MQPGDIFKVGAIKYKVLHRINDDTYRVKSLSSGAEYTMDEFEMSHYKTMSNPYPREHSARIHAPSMFKKFRRQNNKFGQGVHAIWGIRKHGDQHPIIQAIRFDSSRFTATEAKDWLRMHGARSGDVKKFEPATGKFKKNPKCNKPIHTSPSVRWWIGLTKDFRTWEIFGTRLYPHTHHMFHEYVWFYGPFNSKKEAELFKKAECLRNPPNKKK